jgi:hypothetical protein
MQPPVAAASTGVARWLRRLPTICNIAIVAMLAFLAFHRTSDSDAVAQERPRAQPCARWDDMASKAIVQLVQNKRDVDLRQLGDAIFRMRRARRSCEGGWFRLACEDYQAIMRGTVGPTRPFPESPPLCAIGLIDEAVSHRRPPAGLGIH